jgi:hypothetical protein
MKNIYFIFLFIITFIYSSREVTTLADGSVIPDGAYLYEAYNKSGKMIVYGLFELNKESDKISGNWNFKEVKKNSAPSIFIGIGSLQASKNGEKFLINLNPNFIDNNIILTCNMNGDVITGAWAYDGWAPNLTSGTFRAEKNNN